ncbi:prepilin peptidase [Paucisalibacillus globulus]|uniref:prepilin peptidase n=1 Tax=Paucisalibacillus globulus TaxID=351095 RepID=UPI000424E2DC|nr:A24 family peptidase [Paucisalibacillus globulus]
MEIFAIGFLFVVGMVFGSFFNVVGLRLPKGIPFSNDRSICPVCRHQLSWYELIPVVSYLIQGGKCRHCAEKISFIYPFMELLTGFLFSYSYVQLGFTLELIKALLLISLSMILVVSDIKYMIIPNKVLLFFLPFFIVLNIFRPIEPWWSPIAGAVVGFSMIALIIIVSRGGMGAGDMKLFGLLGLVLGLPKVLLTFFIACLLGSVFGIFFMLIGIIKRKQPVPFGPYIIIATLITYFFSDPILHFYFSLI